MSPEFLQELVSTRSKGDHFEDAAEASADQHSPMKRKVYDEPVNATLQKQIQIERDHLEIQMSAYQQYENEIMQTQKLYFLD